MVISENRSINGRGRSAQRWSSRRTEQSTGVDAAHNDGHLGESGNQRAWTQRTTMVISEKNQSTGVDAAHNDGHLGELHAINGRGRSAQRWSSRRKWRFTVELSIVCAARPGLVDQFALKSIEKSQFAIDELLPSCTAQAVMVNVFKTSIARYKLR